MDSVVFWMAACGVQPVLRAYETRNRLLEMNVSIYSRVRLYSSSSCVCHVCAFFSRPRVDPMSLSPFGWSLAYSTLHHLLSPALTGIHAPGHSSHFIVHTISRTFRTRPYFCTLLVSYTLAIIPMLLHSPTLDQPDDRSDPLASS